MRIKQYRKKIIASVVAASITVASAGMSIPVEATGVLAVSDLAVEYAQEPLGIERQDPVFGWKLEKGTTRSVIQKSYHIVVTKDGNKVWDSGIVESNKNNGIKYEGEILESGTQYEWTVEVVDNQGGTTTASSTFGTGLFDESAWNGAQWISNIGGTQGGSQTEVPVVDNFVIETAFELESGSFGLMFGKDTSNFYMWQINAVQTQIDRGEKDASNVTTEDKLVFRPHKWENNGPALLGEFVIGDSETIQSLKEGTHTLKVEVNGTKVKTYLDGEVLTYTEGYKNTQGMDGEEFTLPSGNINGTDAVGVRVNYSSGNLDKDAIKVDELSVKDSNGTYIYFDDFTGSNSLNTGTVVDGKLELKPTTEGATLVVPKESDDNQYSMQADVQILYGATGLLVGGTTSSQFYMWQLNTFNYPSFGAADADKLTYLRPHVKNGGWTEYGNDINVNDVLSKADAEDQMNQMRIDVDNGTITTFINGVQVDERESAHTFPIGQVGFRMAQESQAAQNEKGLVDNVMLRDGSGKIISFDDFENGENPYSSGTIENGALKIDNSKGEVILRDAETEASQVTTFAKDFTAETKEIKNATIYASALGHYELSMNGAKIGDEYMAPGWTEYDTRVQYQAYDVTEQVKQGNNRLGATMAPGWYTGNISILGNNIYGNSNSMIANLVIEYTDGSRQTVVTDGTWNYSAEGPIVETDMFDGETYDANKELGGSKYGWTKEGYDLSEWGTAGVTFDSAYTAQTAGNTMELTAQIGEGTKVIEELAPVSITEVGGKWIVDMGQNFAGIAELSLKGKQGETATIRYGEMLNDDEEGSRGNDNPDGPGSIYTANLRSAEATDKYVFKSNEKETWEPTFTFHGFRYIEISGCEKPELSDIKGYALASVETETGTFESSNILMNQIYSNSFWGQRSNFLSIPTDCPQRDERMGWGADTHVYSRTGLYNMDSNMFYQKWLQDVRDGQYADGGYGDVAPNPHDFRNDVVWAAGGVIVPYDIWMMTGDTRILEDSYDSMKAYMGSRTNGGLIQACKYGDWLEPVDGTSNKQVIGTTYLAYQYSLMAEIAEVLGHTEDVAHYNAKFEEVKAEFHKTLVSEDGTINGNAQSAYVLALGVGLQTPETEAAFVEKLVARIMADGNLMSVGFVSVNKLMPVLSKYGHNNIAYTLATNTAYPSWGYSIEQGATTVWERWNSYTKEGGFGPVSMNSFNHYAFGSVTEWFYSGIGGIKPDTEKPGFENIIIEPQFDTRTVDPMTSANVSYDSARGKVVSAWEKSGDTITLNVTVPANATATVILPTQLEQVEESGKALAQADGVTETNFNADKGVSEIQIGSGAYTFTFGHEVKVDKSALSVAIKAATDMVSAKDEWTATSLKVVEDALKAAQEVYDDTDATAQEVSDTTTALNDAVKGLESRNMARGKSVTTSSEINASGGFASRNLTDGTRSGGGETTWSSKPNPGEVWVQIDLEESKEIDNMVIYPRNDSSDPTQNGLGFPRDFTIQVSEDGTTWETIITETDYPEEGKTVGIEEQRFDINTSGRYVKMTMTKLNDSTQYAQLAEIELYEGESTTTPVPVDKLALVEAINEVEAYVETEYTEATWKTFADSLAAAKAVVAKADATQAEVDGAKATLEDAVSKLEKKTPVEPEPPVGQQPVEQVVSGTASELLKPSLSEETAKRLFATEELEGDDKLQVNLKVDVKDMEALSTEEKAEIERALTEGKLTLGQVLDITMEKVVGDVVTPLETLTEKVRITITIPENLRADNRVFSIVRMHNGVAEVLTDLDENPETFTFETDRFSLYTLAYANAPVNPEPPVDPTTPTNPTNQTTKPATSTKTPETGDETNAIPMMVLLAMSVVGIGYVVIKKKEKNI